MAGLLAAQGPVGAVGDDAEIKATRNVNSTRTDVNPGRLYAAPALAVDPNNPKTVIGSYGELRSRRCGIIRSTDGGATWSRPDASPLPEDYPNCVWNNFSTQAAMGRNGNAYVAITGWDERDGGPRSGNMSLLIGQSSDLGDSWRTIPVSPARGKEGEQVEQQRPASLAVDAKSGSNDIIYAGYNKTMPNRTAPNAEPSRPMVAVSTDGGRTFTTTDLSQGVFNEATRQQAFSSGTTTTVGPGTTTTSTTVPPAGSRASQPNQEANFGGSNPRLAVDNKGTVYATWRSAASNLPGSQPVAPGLFLSKSTDKGKTWNTSLIAFDYTIANPARVVWSKEGDSQGSLHFVYGRNPTPELGGNGDIFHQRSTDGGRTWSTPKQITDDDPATVVGQYIPNISVAPNGRVDVAWWDTRDDPGIRANDAYYAYSEDNGETWSKNMRLSDETINRTYGVWANNYDVSLPIGLASTNAHAVFGWDDTRHTEPGSVAVGEFGGGVQDIYTSVVQFEAFGGGTPKAAKIALAAIAGLAVVAGLLLLATMVSRRGNPPTPKPKKVDKKPGVKVG